MVTTATSLTESVCAGVARKLASTLGQRKYEMWFDRSARFVYDDERDRLEVAVPNRFVADWIGKHFQQELRQAVNEMLGDQADVQVEVHPERFNAPAGREQTHNPAGARQTHAPALRLNTAAPAGPRASTWPHLRHSLDEFIIGSGNELAYAAATQFVAHDTLQISHNHPTVLFIHGGCGMGKTHLLQGVCQRMLDNHPDARVMYTTGEQFTNEFLTAVRNNRIDAFRKRIRRLDLLAVDDVHFIANKEATQREFLHSLDSMDLGGARLVMASDSHPKQIKQFSEALISRCVRGMVAQIHEPDQATRQRIVMALAQRRGIRVLEPAAEILARRCHGSVRDIEGALTKLHALATIAMQRPGSNAHRLVPFSNSAIIIDRALVDQLFTDTTRVQTKRAIRFETILNTTIRYMNVDRKDVMGRTRKRAPVLARAMVIHLAYTMTTMSYPEIASAMGRGNHSTIITADKRIEKQIANKDETFVVPDTLEQITLADLADRLREEINHA